MNKKLLSILFQEHIYFFVVFENKHLEIQKKTKVTFFSTSLGNIKIKVIVAYFFNIFMFIA